MSKINFIPCVYWIKKGVAKQTPNKIELTKEDLKRIIEEHKQNVDSDDENNDRMSVSSEEVEESNENNENVDKIVEKYDLENYDEDSEGELGSNNLNNLANLTVFASNDDDPYLQNEDNPDESEENEDFCIKATDNLIIVGHVESDASILEVQVYSEDEEHYVHHDVILPAYPICFQWINYSPNSEEPVNHIAIGDMSKDLCIWDLDTVNSLEPVVKLVAHEDAVLDLSWNSILCKMLASGSADQSCCLWDLEKNKVISRFDHFKSNVQSVEFHPFEAQTLLIGDSKGVVSIGDCQSGAFKTWKVGNCEVEKVIWNQYNPYTFFCSTSDGFVCLYDVRNNQKAVYSIKAHNDSVTGLALSGQCSGCLLTASTDKVVKIWDVDETKAEFIAGISDLNIGAILTLSANPDLPFIFAVGGDNHRAENFKIIDISKSTKVSSHFVPRISKTSDKNEKKN